MLHGGFLQIGQKIKQHPKIGIAFNPIFSEYKTTDNQCNGSSGNGRPHKLCGKNQSASLHLCRRRCASFTCYFSRTFSERSLADLRKFGLHKEDNTLKIFTGRLCNLNDLMIYSFNQTIPAFACFSLLLLSFGLIFIQDKVNKTRPKTTACNIFHVFCGSVENFDFFTKSVENYVESVDNSFQER